MKTIGNSVRVIAGKWRSRKLSFPDLDGLRPTADRIRETLFNWLQHDIVQEDCLDLFAGSGACGIEALSRQARHVTFIDSSGKALAAIRSNLAMLGADNVSLLQQDALSWLQSSPPQRFGIVFVDPPFADQLQEKSCLALEASGVLKAKALVYIESAKPASSLALPANWHILKNGRAGAVCFCLCQRQPHAEHCTQVMEE